jgi:hypothetical protein
MAHIAADRVRETTTTTGTGALTLAGAVGGHRAFSAVCADGDTVFYVISHRTLGEWERGTGTYSAGTLTRTLVRSSSNAGAVVTLSAGTKDVTIVGPAGLAQGSTITTAPSAKVNDYAPTGFNYTTAHLRLVPTASMGLTGLLAGDEGQVATLHNDSAGYLVWLEHENTASSAANRIDLPDSMPAFLMPGDYIALIYDGGDSRWKVWSWPSRGQAMGLSVFDDFLGSTTGPFTSTVNGTGASAQASTYGVNTTERAMGATQLDTGTTATGRATLGSAGAAGFVSTLGPALSMVRLAAEALPDGSQTFVLYTGFADSAGGTLTDGICWELRWNGSAAEWAQTRAAAATPTRDTGGSPTPDKNYHCLGVFINENGTRADYLYSGDAQSFTVVGSRTTGLPSSTQYPAWVAASIIKSVGNTQRNVSIDGAGYRVDYLRA